MIIRNAKRIASRMILLMPYNKSQPTLIPTKIPAVINAIP
jgi:hypothetical protein